MLNNLRFGENEDQTANQIDPAIEDELMTAKAMHMMNNLDTDEEDYQPAVTKKNVINDEEEDEDALFNKLLTLNNL
jgi:hypothetical protein